MKAVILCGGKGTRMREETEYRPKPLVDVGGRPIIWHIMKTYSQHGINDFILCLGYKGDMIKQYFKDMYWINNNYTMHIDDGRTNIEYHTKEEEKWNVTLVDTGAETLTAGRLKNIEKYINDDDDFLMTYGDGLSDVNIKELIEYHKIKGKTATLTGVHPMSPFGVIEVEDGIAKTFKEKPRLEGMINGGYMVLNKEIFKYIPEEDCMFEEEPLRAIAKKSELAVFEHNGFWMAIDTFKDVENVNKMCKNNDMPWKTWE